MDEDVEKRVRGSRISEVDKLRNLPDSLLYQILLNLPTKDVVKTSLLSSIWRNLWRNVPGLDLEYGDFPNYNTLVSFINRFLGFNNDCLQKFELKDRHCLDLEHEWKWDEPEAAGHVTQWISTVVKRKVQYLDVLDQKEKKLPLTMYTCESLVSLKLCEVILAKPESVSLPSIKVIILNRVDFANDAAFEMLVSGCPVLESLIVLRSPYDSLKVLRVYSQSLLRLTYVSDPGEDNEEDQVIAIDAPRLEYLKLVTDFATAIMINPLSSISKVDIDVQFYFSLLRPERNMICNFFSAVSSVKDMIISSDTLKTIYDYSGRLPIFRNLSSLRADFSDYGWELLSIFLECCPNLKSLSMKFSRLTMAQPLSILPGPHCIPRTLEYVEIVRPMIDNEAEIKLVTYFLKNSTVLKKLTLFLDPSRKNEASVILEKLLTIPRLSTSCQVVVSGPHHSF